MGVVLCVCWLGAGTSSPARGQAAPAGAAASAGAQQSQAKQFYEQGRRAIQQNQWEQARTALLEAWRLKQHWQIAGTLGLVEHKLGQYRDTAEHLAYFLREAQAVPEDEMAQARAMLDEARQHVGEIRITVNEVGADVRVNGELVGKTPLQRTIFVEPGSTIIETRKDGYGPERVQLNAAPGAVREVHVNLEASDTLGKAHAQAAETSQGADGRSASRWSPAVIGGLSVSAVAIGGGTVAAILSNQKGNEASSALGGLETSNSYCLNNASASCTNIRDLRLAQNTFGNLAMWSFIAGGAVAAGTVIYALANTKARQAPPPLLPVVTGRGGGVVANFTW